MRRRKVTYRPSKAQGAFGMVWGSIFVIIGLVVVIPSAGAFGVLWTLMAIGITVMNGYQAFGKQYSGPEIHIEEEGGSESMNHSPAVEPNAKQRLEQLESLRTSGLITQQEYEEKREEIIARL